MMKYFHGYVLFFMLGSLISCKRQNKPDNPADLPKETIQTETTELVTSSKSYGVNYHTQYEYKDLDGKSVIIQNSFPKGGNRYTNSHGERFGYAVFWTRIINETDNPLDLKIDFPVKSFEVPFLPGKYFSVLLPPDTLTRDKEALLNYGLTDLEPFFAKHSNKPAALKGTINPKESGSFYVVILSNLNPDPKGGSALRSGLSLEGKNLFYGIKSEQSDEAIQCGTINLNLK